MVNYKTCSRLLITVVIREKMKPHKRNGQNYAIYPIFTKHWSIRRYNVHSIIETENVIDQLQNIENMNTDANQGSRKSGWMTAELFSEVLKHFMK